MDRHGSFSVVSTKALHVGYGMGRHAGKPLGIHKMLAENPGRKSWQKILAKISNDRIIFHH